MDMTQSEPVTWRLRQLDECEARVAHRDGVESDGVTSHPFLSVRGEFTSSE
jgi:hypothetical protein